MPKPKRVNLSKEQIAAQMKIKSMRSFVKDKFYPALLKSTSSIDDAKFLLSSFGNMMFEQFLSQMKDTYFVDLHLEKKLDKTSPSYKEYFNLLTLFGDKNVFEARELIEGMKAEIEMMINNELKERKLETLKTNFL